MRQNPASLGTEMKIGSDWQVQLIEVNPDAWSIVKEENMFNEPPAEGKQYVMARFKVSCVGEESGTPWVILAFHYLENNGHTYLDNCGVIPENIMDIGEQFFGASAEGDECCVVPSSAIPGGSIIVEEIFSLDNTRVFFEGVPKE